MSSFFEVDLACDLSLSPKSTELLNLSSLYSGAISSF